MIDGRYSLKEEIGVGGMATVWRATDTLLGRELAIKRLSPHLKSDKTASERFRREGQAAARLNHPGILTVFDAGEDLDGPWIAMELIAGETLAHRLAVEGAMDLNTVSSVIAQAAAAVDYAHANGIVHRDIKPANLMVDAAGRVRLADFGIAKPMDDAATITTPGDMVGTISYVAPEIIGGGPASAASDIYSLAAVAYEMLTGERPFSGDTTASLLEAIRHGDGPVLAGKVPPQAIPALARALARDPADRPGSAKAFAAELMQPSTLVLPVGAIPVGALPAADQPVAPVVSPGSPDDPTVLLPPSADAPRSPPAALEPVQEPKGNSGRMIAAASALALLVVIAALNLLGGNGEAQNPPSTTDPPTTTASVTTTTGATTTSFVETMESLVAEMNAVLAGTSASDFKRKDVREFQSRLMKSIEHWQEGDLKESANSMEDAMKSVEDFPESQARDDLVPLLVRLAEMMELDVFGQGD